MGAKSKTAFNTSRLNAFSFNPKELVLVEDETDPLFDPRIKMPLDDALVKNIMFQGIIEPVVITKRDGQAIVIAGRQRVRAAREANKRLEEMGKEPLNVPCVVRRGNEADLFGVSISENENRQDDSPLGKAEKCARYLSMGKSEEEAALTFGVSKQCIQSWLKLLECSAPVRKAVEEGKIAATAALKLSPLPYKEQQETLQGLMEKTSNGKRITARQTAKATGQKSSRMKSRKEILKKLEESGLSPNYKKALQWVLGDEEG